MLELILQVHRGWSTYCILYLLQVPWQPRHNQQLSWSHVVDLNHVSYHWIWGYGTKHILWKRSLPPDGHYGEKSAEKLSHVFFFFASFVNLLKDWLEALFFCTKYTSNISWLEKSCWQANEIRKKSILCICSCPFLLFYRVPAALPWWWLWWQKNWN